ncbi:MAG: spore coat protein CotJB [Clostridiales bacterium GWE2_32_10]|nr:MAG: spore coat protein CotJB [Clostridiales bacterium GWE2_32_10]HBY20846.1 spore coat protein CotJB [Clostridiales bacterium]
MQELDYEELSREELKLQIQELEFAVIELNLFLDTHPTNQKALMDYNMFSIELNKTKNVYQKKYGPLTNFGYALSSYPWKWVESPWPWEE